MRSTSIVFAVLVSACGPKATDSTPTAAAPANEPSPDEVVVGADGYLEASRAQVARCRATLQARCAGAGEQACRAQWACEYIDNKCSLEPALLYQRRPRAVSYVCGVFIAKSEHDACQALRPGEACWQTDPAQAERERCHKIDPDQCEAHGCERDIAFGDHGTGGPAYCAARR